MQTSDFHFELPSELIAQRPAAGRDASRLLVLKRDLGTLEHRRFNELPQYLRAGDVLVLNNSRVIPARLRAVNARTGGQFEALLLEENAPNDWWLMLRPGKRARIGAELVFKNSNGALTGITARVTETNAEGHRRVRFAGTDNLLEMLEELGEIPLPFYITRPDAGPTAEDRERYQTVFAQTPGSVAAPTAGLHFTEELLAALRAGAIELRFVTLHVGLGTFAPVKAQELKQHLMHTERFELSAETAQAVNQAKAAGRRVVAVGTTSLRVLEAVAAQNAGRLVAGPGRTALFIYPPYEFRVVDALLTNFHLPRSTLLMLASAFAAPGKTTGRERLLGAYGEAIRLRYRFFSYGDAMLLL
jgi:S-adenosylmethionine:tRNA ribosyltransferase-isomerase